MKRTEMLIASIVFGISAGGLWWYGVEWLVVGFVSTIIYMIGRILIHITKEL